MNFIDSYRNYCCVIETRSEINLVERMVMNEVEEFAEEFCVLSFGCLVERMEEIMANIKIGNNRN